MFWALGGPILLVATAQAIASRKLPPGHPADFAFALILAAMLVARRLDRPPGTEDRTDRGSVEVGSGSFARWTIGALVAAALVLAIAHFVAPALF